MKKQVDNTEQQFQLAEAEIITENMTLFSVKNYKIQTFKGPPNA